MSKPFPAMTGVSVAESIARIFAADGIVPRVVVDPTARPSWNPQTHTITLPALPTHDLTEEEQAQLRAYFWHESQGEQSMNTWASRPEIRQSKQRQRLANGIGDAFMDLAILEDRPGAGTDIRATVAQDFATLASPKHAATVQPSVGFVASALRWTLERVATWSEVRQAFPQCGELLDYVEPVAPSGTTLRSGDDVVRLTLAVDAALDAYRDGADQQQGDGDGDGQQQPGQGQPGQPGQQQPGQQQPSQQQDGQQQDGQSQSEQQDGQQQDGQSQSEQQQPGQQQNGQSQPGQSGQQQDSKGQPGQSGQQRPGQSGGKGASRTSGMSEAGRPLADGNDSGDRIADKLRETLLGHSGGKAPSRQNRTFHDAFRCVVTGDMLDRSRGAQSYSGDDALRYDAAVLANRLRAALTGPSLRQERGQEYGRFDARRAAAAMAGSRNTYIRRREIPGDDVAVALSWDESGSMSSGPNSPSAAVRKLASRFAVALDQLPNVVSEMIGWTTGGVAGEMTESERTAARTAIDNARKLGKGAHTAGDEVTHRIYKGFHESGRTALARMGMITGRSGTPMTEGFAFSARRLASRNAKRKVLFFLTDGEASGADTSEDAPWGYNALAYEVTRAARNGVDVIVLQIGEDALSQAAEYEKMAADEPDAGRKGMLLSMAREYRARVKRNAEQWGGDARLLMCPPDAKNLGLLVANALVDLLTRKSRTAAASDASGAA